MVDDLAACVQTAAALTGISALVVDAGLVRGALGADYALRTTARRCANVPRLTRAHRVPAAHTTQAVRTTR